MELFTNDILDYTEVILSMLDEAKVELSNELPSDWIEKNRILTSEMSALEGMFDYYNSPYSRELIDTMSSSHPAHTIAIKKSAQIGITEGLVLNALVWQIKNDPGNALLLIGKASLLPKMAKDLDNAIDSSGVRKLIAHNSGRIRKTKSGDTDYLKEYSGGSLTLGVTDAKFLRQMSMRYMFIDDMDAMPITTKEAGDTVMLIEQRASAFANKSKTYFLSSPEEESRSNIERVYKLGDQRKWHIPCPCCGEKIVLYWEIEGKHGMAGITWELDEQHNLITKSVGYTCQECGGFFDDSQKMTWLNQGEWIPTAKAKEEGWYSYHINALCSPIFMTSWTKYVYKYLRYNPVNGVRDEEQHKSFVNLVLGECYTPKIQDLLDIDFSKNKRHYEAGTVPEELSVEDNNGEIVMLSCGIDLGGLEEDARVDWLVKAYSAKGQEYHIAHGSIGTFVNKRFRDVEYDNAERIKWSYKHGSEYSVWPEVENLIRTKFPNSATGLMMPIVSVGLDTGHFTKYAYEFCNAHTKVYALKGADDAGIKKDADMKHYKRGLDKRNLFHVQSNYCKDLLAENIALSWVDGVSSQPEGFMNFPIDPTMFQDKNYFSHLRSEEKRPDDKGKYRWVKKQNHLQNHMLDCNVYCNVAKQIFVDTLFKKLKITDPSQQTWSEFAKIVLGY